MDVLLVHRQSIQGALPSLRLTSLGRRSRYTRLHSTRLVLLEESSAAV
ncbi:hypothetical protein SLEP1_g58515 [Rubroshorea leprosula]|uniref:Uncharacterized protein n=1 Tax=Rubroshorea leprosula TaxID=152421 RepID=A0AAV5MU37_9ROSI|nr:hypothetical protein SLEP1_g58515 [Rubroshorea leprosula]